MFKIGTAADKDIYGNKITAAFTRYDSGFNPAKKGNHFHYVASHVKDFASRASYTGTIRWLAVIMGIIGMAVILTRIAVSSTQRRSKDKA